MGFNPLMIGLRLPVDTPGAPATLVEVWIEDHEFEAWVRSGRIRPETPVWTPGGPANAWRAADDLEIFHLFRPEAPAPVRPEVSLREVIFPRRGFSGTEFLLLANIAVSVGLLATWRENYTPELWGTMRSWWAGVAERSEWWRMLPTIVMHADAGHLARNLGALLVTAGGVEVFFGRARTLGLYLATGALAALASYLGHDRPPLSVGASGAVFGLAGVLTSFLVKYAGRFSERQKWKARRVYAPLLLFLVPPSLFHADWMAHVGGFAAGLVAGLVLPLSAAGRALLGQSAESASMAAPPDSPAPDSAPPRTTGGGS
jgi:membrane associated rhomboid family serine protease